MVEVMAPRLGGFWCGTPGRGNREAMQQPEGGLREPVVQEHHESGGQWSCPPGCWSRHAHDSGKPLRFRCVRDDLRVGPTEWVLQSP